VAAKRYATLYRSLNQTESLITPKKPLPGDSTGDSINKLTAIKKREQQLHDAAK
jgi:hypothetical protein